MRSINAMKRQVEARLFAGLRGSNGMVLLLAAAMLLVALVSASAVAANEASSQSDALLPTSAEVAAAIEATGSEGLPGAPTDPSAVEGASLESLQRDEALEVLNGVFKTPVEEAAGIYDELQQAELLSSHVAVLPEGSAPDQGPTEDEPEAPWEGDERSLADGQSDRDAAAEALPEAEAREVEGPPPEEPAELAKASLLDSTIPLEVGSDKPLDLSLQRQAGHLEPAAPLVQAHIPDDLGEKIELPEVGIGIEVANVSTERAASITDGSVAFYPNIAEDTDLAISPTPSGVETMSQLRSADSPKVSIYRLSLPAEASLVKSKSGGAEVRVGEEALLTVPAPSATDASGQSVPVNLEIEGDNLNVRVEPAADAPLPILVDPLFQTYEWAANNTRTGICSNSFQQESFYSCNNREEWGYEVFTHYGLSPAHMQADNHEFSIASPPGIAVKAELAQTAGDHATVLYTVPRYFKETPPPTSFIKSLKLSDVKWRAQGQYASPYLFMGIWDSSTPSWVSYYPQSGQTGHGLTNTEFLYSFEDKFSGATQFDREAKAAEIGISATESTSQSNAEVYVGAATVELGDEGAPKPPQPVPQTQWVNQSAPPIAFTASDYGLGVDAVTASTEEVDLQGNALHTWTAKNGCVGVGDSACPRTWNSSVSYEPSVLPSGIDYLGLIAEDPLGNKSATGLEEVRVDHIPPTLNVTGSMTEQDALGTRRASYTLKATASDGNAEHPQSGLAKAEVKLDGKAVALEGKQAEEWTPACTTRNCLLSAEWTLNCSSVAEGKHTIEVIATDAAGNVSAPKTLTIETHPAVAPTLTLSGSMTEQAALGTSRPRYTLKAKSYAGAGGFEAPTLGALPTYASSVGSGATGNGEFSNPADVATDSSGNTWVVDMGRSRLQKFNEKGEWVLSAASKGSGAGMLSRPSGVAADSKGNLWVADTANNRIVEFNEKGEFLETVGTGVNKTKVETGGSEAEKNLCTAASGNVCQAATAGSAAGQLKEPKGIALTSGGNIWVADTGNNRIEKFTPGGVLLNNLSGEGAEPGRLKEPQAITVAPDGSIWVADTGNKRIEQWSSSLAFIRAVGKQGSGAGEFTYPCGIEADANGEIWVADCKGARVEEFDEWGTYLGTFGSAGSGSGQFATQFPAPPGGMAISISAMGVTVDGKGSVWVTDAGNARLQHWTIPGFPLYNSSVGSSGSGTGQFMHLAGLSSDGALGHVWALDQELGRLQKFNEKGEVLKTAGGTGSGAGKLSSPAALVSSWHGQVWVADTGNNRVVEFGENGEFIEAFGQNVDKTKVEAGAPEAEKNLCTAASGDVCQAATSGSAPGQMKSPKGIALATGGSIWVADTGNNRLEKFTPNGGYLAILSSEGSEPGKLKEPVAITVSPDNSIWVADTANNRIEHWNSGLVFIRAVGSEGSGGGEFKAPTAITADISGNVWVADQKNNRVEEFGEGGRYFGQFGASGSGKFSFSAPMGIATDANGTIWVADPGHSKIQKWTQETPRSEITTTISMDGVQKSTLHGACKTTSCTIEPQWTMESAAYEAKSHVARVKITDGLGRSTESTLNLGITRDTTKPTLEASGELFNAPEGWVEQETYGLTATATDAGYGATSIAFKIDGKQVASVLQSCPDGGCKETLSKQISMATYSGGSHPAELVATDGAGNTFVKNWTINVDPEGHISTKEAEATLEAVETTTAETPVASTKELLEPEQIEFGDNPELQQGGSEITSTGVPDITTMTTDPAAGFTIDSPYGETTIVPEVSENASSTSITEGVAGVSANVGNEVDSVIRPEYNGVEIFQAIRSDTSPEKFSWAVHLYEGQRLRLITSHYAEVLYESGKRAFLIEAEQAHDATGKEVPTSLEVSGNVLTLNVEIHKGTFVYPVLAGSGWETSYRVPVLIEGPEDELEIAEREQAQAEEGAVPPPPASGAFTEAEARTLLASHAVGEEIIPAPEPPEPGSGATASSVPEKVVKPFKVCSNGGCGYWHVELFNPSYHYKKTDGSHRTSYWQAGTEVHSTWWYPAYYWPEIEVEGWGCGFTGPNQVWSGQHEHLTAWGRYKITVSVFTPTGDVFPEVIDKGLQIWVWPNGDQQRVETHFEETLPAYEAAQGCH